jgi:hypothetical protein
MTMTDQDEVSAEEMYRRAKKGWFYAFFAFVVQTLFVYFIMRSMMSSSDMSSALIVADEQTIVSVGVPLAIAIFIGGLILRATFTRRGINQQDRQLVLKAVIYGMQASGLIAMMGFVLAVFFWNQYFFLWSILAAISFLVQFPRFKPFVDANYKQF